jgi:hypothetical protein
VDEGRREEPSKMVEAKGEEVDTKKGTVANTKSGSEATKDNGTEKKWRITSRAKESGEANAEKSKAEHTKEEGTHGEERGKGEKRGEE